MHNRSTGHQSEADISVTGVLPAANLKKNCCGETEKHIIHRRVACGGATCDEDLPVLTKELKKVIMIITGE